MLPLAETHQESSDDVKRGEIMHDNVEFTEHLFSNHVAAQTILNSALKYSERVKQKIPFEKMDLTRYELIKELKWD